MPEGPNCSTVTPSPFPRLPARFSKIIDISIAAGFNLAATINYAVRTAISVSYQRECINHVPVVPLLRGEP